MYLGEDVLHSYPESMFRWFAYSENTKQIWSPCRKWLFSFFSLYFISIQEALNHDRTNKTCCSQTNGQLAVPCGIWIQFKTPMAKMKLNWKGTPGLGRISSKAIKLLSKTIISDVKMRVFFFPILIVPKWYS